MKKIGLILAATCFILPSWAGAQTVRINTFYPVPFGEYENIKLNPQGPPVICDGDTLGTFFYDSSRDTLMGCFDGTAFTPFKLWTESGNFLYPTYTPLNNYDPDINLGINTQSASYLFHLHSSTENPPLEGDGFALLSTANTPSDPQPGNIPNFLNVSNFNEGTTHVDSKLFFQPKKAALRAGIITNSPAWLNNAIGSNQWRYWNEGHLGLASIGLGINARAYGRSSIVMGHHAITDNRDHGIAIGRNTYARGTEGIALGSSTRNGSTVSGRDRSIAIGNNAMTNNETISIGLNATSLALNSISITNDTAIARSNASISIGENVTAMGRDGIAIGNIVSTARNYGIVIGENSISDEYAAIALGLNATASGCFSVASGNGSLSRGALSVAFGENAQALSSAAIAIGSRVTAGNSGNTGGNGNSGLGSCAPSASVRNNHSGSIAIGADSTAAYAGSLALGLDNHALNRNTVALGRELTLNNPNSLAIGWKATVNAENTFTINTDPSPTPDPTVFSRRNTAVWNHNNVGINTLNPSARLDVNGTIRVQTDTAGCTASSEGALRFNIGTDTLEFCDDTAQWIEVGRGGLTPKNVYATVSRVHGHARSNLAAAPAGYRGLYDTCQREFPGTHVCSAIEMTNWNNAGFTAPAGGGWIIGNEKDCNGFTSNLAVDQGVYYRRNPTPQSVEITCNRNLKVFCCEYEQQ